MGWGVRTAVDLPPRCFVSVYTGQIVSDFEADQKFNFDRDADKYYYYMNLAKYEPKPNAPKQRRSTNHGWHRVKKSRISNAKEEKVEEEAEEEENLTDDELDEEPQLIVAYTNRDGKP